MTSAWASRLLPIPVLTLLILVILYCNLPSQTYVEARVDVTDTATPPPIPKKPISTSRPIIIPKATKYHPNPPDKYNIEHPETDGASRGKSRQEVQTLITKARECARKGEIFTEYSDFKWQYDSTDNLFMSRLGGQYGDNAIQLLKGCMIAHDLHYNFLHAWATIKLFDMKRFNDYCSYPVRDGHTNYHLQTGNSEKHVLPTDRLVRFVKSSWIRPEPIVMKYVDEHFEKRRKIPDSPMVCMRLDKDNKPDQCEHNLRNWAAKVEVDAEPYLPMCDPTPEWLEGFIRDHFAIEGEFELSMDRIWRIWHPMSAHFGDRLIEIPDRFRTFQKYRIWFFAKCDYLMWFPYHRFDFILRHWHLRENPNGVQFPPAELPHSFTFMKTSGWPMREWHELIPTHVPISTFPPVVSLDDFEQFTHNPNQRTKTVIRLEGFFGRLFNRMTILSKVCFKCHEIGAHLILADDIKDKIDDTLLMKDNILQFCHFKIDPDAKYWSLPGKHGFFVDVDRPRFNDFIGSDYIKFPVSTREWVEKFYEEHKSDRLVVGLHHRGLEGACEWRTEEWGNRYGFSTEEIDDYRRICEMRLEDLEYILREKLKITEEYDFILATDNQCRECDHTFNKLGDRKWTLPKKWGVVGDAWLLAHADVLLWNVDSTIDLFVHRMQKRLRPNGIQYPPAELLHNQLFRDWEPWRMTQIDRPNSTELEGLV